MSKKYTIECSNCKGTGRISVNWMGHRRKKLGLKQQDVADVLGVTRTQVSNIERGQAALTSGKILKLASLYEVSVEELLTFIHGDLES